MTDLYLSTTHFGIQNKIKTIKHEMAEESSPEVTSSCGRLSSSDFREVDLDLWDLDINQQRNQIFHGHGGVVVRNMKTYSETSSMSGNCFCFSRVFFWVWFPHPLCSILGFYGFYVDPIQLGCILCVGLLTSKYLLPSRLLF